MSLKTIIASENAEHLEDTESLGIQPMDEWIIKCLDGGRKETRNTKIFFTTLILLIWIIASWFIAYGSEDGSLLAKSLAIFCTCYLLIAMKLAFQKSVFHYILYPTHCQYHYSLDHPKNMESVLRHIVIGFFITVFSIALYLQSLQVLLFCIIYLIYNGVIRLWHWKRPAPQLIKSAPWQDFKTVIIDRKYRIVMLLIDEPTIGFEVRLLDDQHVERYLAFLQTVLPPHVRYREETWEW
ncbi:hypothetical protein RRX38_23260 [Pseudomonas sp. DTU_2021_1001937_2_SI_NGA_ILE_001]|uniref:hypothetical protein n=1 Tax=Pseudomonas sp. DTU_2021_1001937_2_SI_NGA_ILE_001 TaxID=3077589 RepID=UPI0028FC2ACF|nr:hypothetical protein [Pseudomonas sp. DTU_2021_1001937_2_SI_NGA_ILE_001]WNW13953.1 hypothetical protein RRX38_23260 [Pseudomonas sp. DTU_2021_1001937_2_SI_NGA_ILE_001]